MLLTLPQLPLRETCFSEGVNIEPTNKSKEIQAWECEGYGHIQSECANTCKKNKSYTVIWSDEDYDEQEEPFNEVMVLVSLATIEDSSASAASNAASSLGQMLKVELAIRAGLSWPIPGQGYSRAGSGRA